MAQMGHAAFELGNQLGWPEREHNYIAICQAKSEREILREHEKLLWSYKDDLGDPFVNEIFLFREEDLNNEATALAVYFNDEEKRRMVRRWKLWKE